MALKKEIPFFSPCQDALFFGHNLLLFPSPCRRRNSLHQYEYRGDQQDKNDFPSLPYFNKWDPQTQLVRLRPGCAQVWCKLSTIEPSGKFSCRYSELKSRQIQLTPNKLEECLMSLAPVLPATRMSNTAACLSPNGWGEVPTAKK